MAVPTVPLTLEGSYALHQMVRIRWGGWRNQETVHCEAVLAEAVEALAKWDPDQSMIYSMLGHKGDLMLVHFRKTLEELNEVERELGKLRIWQFLEVASSYVSVVELGLYESTQRIYRVFTERGLQPDTPEWKAALDEELDRQKTAMAPRLYPAIPKHKYICFYPMDRKRGEDKNWYQVEFGERARMMHEHGMVGRKYADVVRQIITGSVGFDDWEWGVTLFTEDPLWFKKLIYEMRFDEVSAVYALFGTFFVGIRSSPNELRTMLL